MLFEKAQKNLLLAFSYEAVPKFRTSKRKTFLEVFCILYGNPVLRTFLVSLGLFHTLIQTFPIISYEDFMPDIEFLIRCMLSSEHYLLFSSSDFFLAY